MPMSGRHPEAGAASLAGSDTQHEARRLIRWLLVPILGLLAVLSFLQYQQGMDDAESVLQRRADERSQELLALARPATAHVHDMRRLLESSWDDPPSAPAELFPGLQAWPLQAGVPPQAIDGWTLDGASAPLRERWGQFWWGSMAGEAPDDTWVRRFALVQRHNRAASERSPGFEGSYFVSVERNVSWSYPWVDTPGMLKAMGVQTLRELDSLRIRSFQGTEAKLTPELIARGNWGQPYVSQIHGRLVQSHMAPVMVNGRYQGEVSVDFRLDTLQAVAELWQDTHHELWVLDHRLRVVADAAKPLQAPGERGVANQLIEIPVATRLPEGLAPALLPRLTRPNAVSLTHLPGWLVISATRQGSPWIYLQLVPASQLRQQVLMTLLPNALIGLALLGVFLWGQWLFTRWFVNPALGVLGYLRELSANPAAPAPDLGRRWAAWVKAVRLTVQAQHQQREQIERQREALRRSERLSTMGTMLASVAHELNNPLAVAMGRAALLEDRVLAASDASSPAAWAVRDDARRVREAAERCARIVTNFLNFARQRPPSRCSVVLRDAVQAAADLLSHRLRSHHIRLTLALPDDLPAVKTDPDQLVQVLLNLLLNAQQAMEGQARERVIALTAGCDNPQDDGHLAPGWVWLRVVDTGPGVPASIREKLFEPFFTTKEQGQGTGLGLSISRNLLQEHGGDLVLESSSAEGSCFCVRLPAAAPEEHAQGPTVTERGVGSPPASVGTGPAPGLLPDGEPREQPRILVVDGDQDMAELVLATLENAGYEVAIAESGSVAQELLDEVRFDAIVSGVHVPDLSVGELQALLRQRAAELAERTLFITGDALSPGTAAALEHSGRPWLEKPFTRDELLTAMQRLLGTGDQAQPAEAALTR
jgi:signal transduction histidine kinase/ActR/RegA family two-component response regulator